MIVMLAYCSTRLVKLSAVTCQTGDIFLTTVTDRRSSSSSKTSRSDRRRPRRRKRERREEDLDAPLNGWMEGNARWRS